MVEHLVVSKSGNVEPEVHAIDSVNYFVIEMKYQDRDELINWFH